MAQPNEEPPPTYDGAYPAKQEPPMAHQPPPSPTGGTTVVHVQPSYGQQPGYQVQPSYAQAGQPQPYGNSYGQPPPPQPVVITNGMLSHDPVTLTCPHCGQTVSTRTSYQVGTATWVIAGGLCFFGCCLGCCLIPFCFNQAKDCKHECPSCNRIIGTHKLF
uniref:LITAF domain-containing protein n=1 Tax=Chromera velia CCMP2878 TaxID=1169474 RepID=A0A0G4FTW0_9ALVE|mmetsp:Transcript_49023/g.96684  ORF Transcript_49023/g.96684 Transcript_49023/m.96684 type:complete len:161 (-) Transcript_49023:472-954(-)|eukprot:Cvel_18752.t1-p1 / transcript=Cvel_18752.t1 / gene=Cvel_18752 / organism=Chromera_velia_CCMP2878 / gene_product=Lipopolysaccharide-induced tumor necrosis, putative / transcript_product=Lipopolysaccharide-induced tumor necrosis, putative / location=Cvel_scaffold1572:36185-36664(-) / protein_length=160 / sequence_SO=supercontig / SO=protein_coding / is_pseudo=false